MRYKYYTLKSMVVVLLRKKTRAESHLVQLQFLLLLCVRVNIVWRFLCSSKILWTNLHNFDPPAIGHFRLLSLVTTRRQWIALERLLSSPYDRRRVLLSYTVPVCLLVRSLRR